MTAFAWRIPDATDQAISANAANDHLAAINAVVVANETGGHWEVASYSSSSPRSVVLRPQNGAPGRLIFFGEQGSTPHANAVSGSPTASVLYNGYSPSSTSNSPDASWIAGAPLSASDYMPGFRCMSLTSANTLRVNYAESEDCFYMLFGGPTPGMAVGGGGKLAMAQDGTLVDAVMGSGSSGSTGWATAVTASGSIFPAQVASSYTSTDAGLMIKNNSQNRFAYRAIALATGVSAKLLNTSDLRAHFHCVPLVFTSTYAELTVAGKIRQVAFGPNCLRETRYSAGGINAYGHQSIIDPSLIATATGLWFVDLEV